MEIIRTYLENMFLRLPATPEVIRAKRELLDMMEDKYRELKAQGKTENEAVGTVIAEFGNLEEVAEALGITQIVFSKETEQETADFAGQEAADDPFSGEVRGAKIPDEPDISLDIAKQYLKGSSRQALLLGIGCALCICSPVGVVIMSSFEQMPGGQILLGIGTVLLFVMVAAAVGLFIYGSVGMSEWKDVRYGGVSLSYQTIEYLREQKSLTRPMFALFLTIGIALCVLSPIPAVIGEALSTLGGPAFTELAENIGAAVLLVMVAAGVFFIVYATKRYHAITNLIKRGGITIDESARTGDTVRESKQPKKKTRMKSEEKRFKDLWKQTVVCVYLIWSFLTFRWWITWIIFPISNALYKLVRTYRFGREED